MDESTSTRQPQFGEMQEAFERAQACEAVGDHYGALVQLLPWSDKLIGPGTSGLQCLFILSLQRLGRISEAETALARFESANPNYPMSYIINGAEAWRRRDWISMIHSYMKALEIEPKLERLWDRVEIGVENLKKLDDYHQGSGIAMLRELYSKPPAIDENTQGLRHLIELLGLLPVPVESLSQRDAAINRARTLFEEIHREIG